MHVIEPADKDEFTPDFFNVPHKYTLVLFAYLMNRERLHSFRKKRAPHKNFGSSLKFLFRPQVMSELNKFYEDILHRALLFVAKVLRKLVFNRLFFVFPVLKGIKTPFNDCVISSVKDRLVASLKMLQYFVYFESIESVLNRPILLDSLKVFYYLHLLF